MRRRTRYILLILLAALLAMAALAYLVPWPRLAEERLKAALAARGFENVELRVARLGFTTILLEDITLGDPPLLTLSDLRLDYTPLKLLSGDIPRLALEGLALEARQTPQGWAVSGLETWERGGSSEPFVIPTSRAALEAFPRSASITSSSFKAIGEGWEATLPLTLGWESVPEPALRYEGEGLAVEAGGKRAAIAGATVSAALNEGEGMWKGIWQLQGITLKGFSEKVEVPVMDAEGTLEARQDRVALTGKLRAQGGAPHRADFALDYHLSEQAASSLLITDASMPWNEGSIAVKQARIPLGERKDIRFALEVRRVSIDALLQTLTGKRASATGLMTGTLPVTFTREGAVVLHEGQLEAEGPGTLALDPATIPSDNPQVALVRDILANFHYTLFSLAVDSAEDGTLTLRLRLEGTNPDVYDERPIKLNVQLQGDVLDFIEQNIGILTDPRQLLKEHYEKP